MKDKEIIEKIEEFADYQRSGVLSINEEVDRAKSQMISYLICRVIEDKNEVNFNTAKHFIEKLDVNQEIKKENLDWLKRVYNFDISAVKLMLTYDIALAPIASICVNDKATEEYFKKCSKKFLDMHSEFSYEEINEAISHCDMICGSIKRYINNIPQWESDLRNNISTDNEILLKSQKKVKTALSFRFGGKEYALKICNDLLNLEKSKKAECNEYVDLLDFLRNCKQYNYGGVKDCTPPVECTVLRQGTIDAICDIDLSLN